MPASPSRPPNTKGYRTAAPAARRTPRWPWLVLGLLLIICVIVSVLPASLIARVLPPGSQAEDFSGTVWHGSAGKIAFNGVDAGALEWQLHPAALLHLAVAANVHWVKTGFVLDGDVEANRGGFLVSNLHGGGPIEDLSAFGLPPTWTGTASVAMRSVQGQFSGGAVVLKSALGDVQVENLMSPRFTDGADIGDYKLHMADGAITPDTDATGEIDDIGGPLEAHAVIRYSPKEKRATLTGTVRERSALPSGLHAQLENLSQLRPRDAQGRIPVDLEFTL